MSQKRPEFDYRYSIIPGAAATDRRLKGRDLQVLALLGRHTDRRGWCRRSQVEMAKELGCGRATLFRAMLRLLDLGYVERLATGRGKAMPDPNKQPFSAFWYRVKIDREDDGDAVEWEVPNNGHPPVEKTKPAETVPTQSGQEVPTQSGHGVPIVAGTLNRTTSSEGPSSNSDARPGAREGGIATLGKGSPERFEEFRSAWAQTMPGGFPHDDERQARDEFSKQTRLAAADAIIACARLHGSTERKRHDARRGGDFRTKKPSNWLRDGGWEGYLKQANEAEASAAALALAMARVRQALGEGLYDILRQLLPHPTSLAALDGMTFEAGPPPVLIASSPVQRILLNKHTFALQRRLGDDLTIILAGGRRSA